MSMQMPEVAFRHRRYNVGKIRSDIMSRGRNMRWYRFLSKEKIVKNLKEGRSQRGIRGMN